MRMVLVGIQPPQPSLSAHPVSPWCPFAAQIRPVVCRLGRRNREAAQKGLPHQSRGPQTPGRAAPQGGRKKTPALGSIKDLCQIYAERYEKKSHEAIVAGQLASTAGHASTAQLQPAHLARVVALWKNCPKSTRYSRTQKLKHLCKFLIQAGPPHPT